MSIPFNNVNMGQHIWTTFKRFNTAYQEQRNSRKYQAFNKQWELGVHQIVLTPKRSSGRSSNGFDTNGQHNSRKYQAFFIKTFNRFLHVNVFYISAETQVDF